MTEDSTCYISVDIETSGPIPGDYSLLSLGACVVALWLWGIILNLLLVPGFYDIALRDFGLSLGALALARLSREFGGAPRLEA